MSKTITFVTGNANKIEEFLAILGTNFPYKINFHAVDLPEIQGDIKEITIKKCREAAHLINGPVLVEDTSLCYNALQGLPGPYVKWFLIKLQPEGLHRLFAGFEDKSADAICTLGYSESINDDPVIFQSITHGTIVAPRGSLGFGWNPIFQPVGLTVTYAELIQEEKNKISHRYLAVNAFREYLGAKNK